MVADTAVNVTGDITPKTISIGNRTVIDENGRWVGDPTGLRGERGPAGDVGPEGPVGPEDLVELMQTPMPLSPLVVQSLTDTPQPTCPMFAPTEQRGRRATSL